MMAVACRYRPYSYCVIDDVIVSIAISITELYGQLSGKRVVLCITKTVKRSSLVFGNNICESDPPQENQPQRGGGIFGVS